MSEKMNLDALLTGQIDVEFGGKTYYLREPSEEVSARFQSTQLRDAKFVDGKLHASVERAAESRALLISLCLFDADGKPVPQKTIREWPVSVVTAIFNRVGQMLKPRAGADEEEEAKNSQGATTGTSA